MGSRLRWSRINPGPGGRDFISSRFPILLLVRNRNNIFTKKATDGDATYFGSRPQFFNALFQAIENQTPNFSFLLRWFNIVVEIYYFLMESEEALEIVCLLKNPYKTNLPGSSPIVLTFIPRSSAVLPDELLFVVVQIVSASSVLLTLSLEKRTTVAGFRKLSALQTISFGIFRVQREVVHIFQRVIAAGGRRSGGGSVRVRDGSSTSTGQGGVVLPNVGRPQAPISVPCVDIHGLEFRLSEQPNSIPGHL